MRKGDWLQTYTGGQFWPLDPRPDDIRIEDIAAALSKLCRYGGHCTRFYSVAEHSVHVAAAAPEQYRLDALLHDAAEAYLVDVPRPVKRYLANYHEIEERLDDMIAKRFHLAWPRPPVVKMLDDAILVDEHQQNMATVPEKWSGVPDVGLGVTLRFWIPQQAAYEFTTAFYRYGGVA